MASARQGACAASLPTGSVLIAGGADINGTAVPGAELFTAEGRFRAVSPMSTARSSAACVLLPSGAVLVAGGIGADGSTLDSAEIFDRPQAVGTPADA
jgi:hypothetical protein